MPRRNVYLPADLDALARLHKLKLSTLLQDAIRAKVGDNPKHDLLRGWGDVPAEDDDGPVLG